MRTIEVEVVIERKMAKLPSFVVVPAKAIASWKLDATTTVDATLDGVSLGRRSLKRWDDERWFVELRNEHLAAIAKRIGDRAKLSIARASEALPAELETLLAKDAKARAAWNSLTDAQRRMLREELLGLKSSAARDRRARRELLPSPAKRAAPIAGLAATPRSIEVRILASELPGTSCGPYTDIVVGLEDAKTRHPIQVVSAGAKRAIWTTTIEVKSSDGVARFYGPAVHGPTHERFFYLDWIGRENGAALAMFRRAKLRLDAIPSDVLARALKRGELQASLGLTDDRAMPLCASVKPPRIQWSVP